MRRTIIWILFFALTLSACVPAASTPSPYPTYDPFISVDNGGPIQTTNGLPQPTRTPGPTPTRASLSVTLPPTRDPSLPILTPTPDTPRTLPTPRQNADQYVVQSGDTLGSIAQNYGISVDALMQANSLNDPNLLTVGMTLNIPAPEPGAVGPSFKIIPDSELVYGPASAQFDIDAFIQNKRGYLASYSEDVNGQTMSAADIITTVSQNYSVNPRLLLAILEYESGWVTKPDATATDYPLGFVETYYSGLYHQLDWAANELNRGFYLWRADAVSTWVLADGSVVPIDPTINAGTAGVQNFFAKLDSHDAWEKDVTAFGLYQTYFFLFGNSFDLAIEPLVPLNLKQPRMTLPFASGETWSFTGGPHGGWDEGSAWAALDFAPPSDAPGCVQSDYWVTAVADGLITRAANGAVIQDLDNDGYEQTGWVVLYMHIETRDRVAPGTYLFAGDKVGHPSCEGGIANGTHVHLARRYNGEWIAADGTLPFNLDGWVSSGTGTEYDGFLKRGSQQVEAWDGKNDANQITH
ncbi:MAG TPA: LysM peptidoglycan-binding domain-containing protein [Anaerolineales bacterium]|nr:LysM peptidoglycan-binding domain-containing protein [Anaerolineales bacterium]